MWDASAFCALLAAASGAALVYHYLGYPAVLYLAAAAKGRRAPRPAPAGSYTPSVSVIIPCYNEERHVGDKVAEVFRSLYPEQAIEVVVVSDGSEDNTSEVAARAGAVVVSWPERRGKPAALNAGVKAARGDVLVFSDANARLGPAALRDLIAPLADEGVGAVAAEQVITDGGRGEGLYWRYEAVVKTLEARLGSVVGADGSLYAVRRELFRPVPEGRLIMDDFYISLSVVAAGKKLAYAPAAKAWEGALEDAGAEVARKARIMAGSIAALVALDRRVWVRIPFGLISHKVLRWLGPVWIMGWVLPAAVGAALGNALAQVLAALAGLWLLCAAIGGIAGQDRAPQPFRGAWTLAAANAALAWGWWRYFFGDNTPAWRKLR